MRAQLSVLVWQLREHVYHFKANATVLTILFCWAAGRMTVLRDSKQSERLLRCLCKRLTRTTSCGFWLSPALASLGPEPCAKERIKGFMTKFSWVLQLGGCDTVRFVCLFLCLLSFWLAHKISSRCSLGSVTWHTCLWTCVANVMVIVQNHHRPSTWTPGLPTVSQTMGRSGIWA